MPLSSIENELTLFMRNYEMANNSHVWDNVSLMIADDASYWFTDGSYKGIDQIRSAIEATFLKLEDEVYSITELRWIVAEESTAVCVYRFSWRATIDGEKRSGDGRGTNILKKQQGDWKIIHEHLSN